MLLLVIGLGMVVAVMLVCVLPLLALATQTAGLRDTLTASPSADEIMVQMRSVGLSTPALDSIARLVTSPFQAQLLPYLQGSPRLEIQTPEFNIITPQEEQLRTPLQLDGEPVDQASSHVTLVQGRLPHAAMDQDRRLEIALTTETARALHVGVGGEMLVGSGFSVQLLRGNAANDFQSSFCSIVPGVDDSKVNAENAYCQRARLVVVGLFEAKINDPFWHGETFQPYKFESRDTRTHYTALVDNTALLAAYDQIISRYPVNTAYFLAGYFANLTWYYYLDPNRLSLASLDNVIDGLTATQVAIGQVNGELLTDPFSPVQQITLSGSVFSANSFTPGTLENYRGRILLAATPILILTLQIVASLLYFISVVITLLIERQGSVIAQMRSRGASTGQVFGAHFTQCLALALVALLVGPLLAFLLVVTLLQRLLPVSDSAALGVLSNDPLDTLLNVRWYALAAVSLLLVVATAALYRASRAMTQNGARPAWQRLNLDLLAAVIALAGFGVSLYLANIGGLLDAHTQALLAAPVSLIAPVFLLLAAVLFLLRFAPVLFAGIGRIAARNRGAVPMLAVTQLARAPRRAVRTLLLLALVTAFAVFALLFSSSQAQRVDDLAAFRAGADFSGAVPQLAQQYPPAVEAARYRAIPGVLAASAGHIAVESAGTPGSSNAFYGLEVRAVDPATFSQAALWGEQNSTQSLSSLLALLASHRSAAIHKGVIPAVVDAATWNRLGLHAGETFLVHQNNTLSDNIPYAAVAEVQSIPTLTGNDTNADLGLSSVIVDYATFASIQQRYYAEDTPANYVWLRSAGDPASLAHVRNALTTTTLYLDQLQDRRALVDSMQHDSAYFHLFVTLALGVAAALLLAIVGDLLASWLSVRERLAQFVVLRSLGASSRQVASIMLWEQGLIYLVALCLGGGFGVLLAFTVIPTVTLATLPGIPGVSVDALYLFSQAFPAQVVFSWSLAFFLLVLLLLCLTAIAVMVRVALRPSMTPVLRVEEGGPPLPAQREVSGGLPELGVRRVVRRAGWSWNIVFGQMRHSWLLLVTTAIGMIAAVVMVCAIPLFTSIMTTAGLQNTLAATPDGSQFTLDASTAGLSRPVIQGLEQQIVPQVQQHMGTYLGTPPRFSVQTSGYSYSPPPSPTHPGTTYDPIKILAAPSSQIASHLTLLSGRLPGITAAGDAIEAVLTQPAAISLEVRVGSVIPIQFQYAARSGDIDINRFKSATIRVRIVGLVNITSVSDYLWHGNTFQAIPSDPSSSSTLMLPVDSYLNELNLIASQHHLGIFFSPYAYELFWDYSLDISKVDYDHLEDIASRLTSLRNTIQNAYGNAQDISQAAVAAHFPYLAQASVYDPLYGSLNILDILNRYNDRVDVLRLPILALVLLVICLILLFISLMADLIVERQAEALAVLRSRGASMGQVVIWLATPGASLGCVALLAGTPLALLVVSLIASRVLGANGPAAVAFTLGNPWQALLDVIWYALATALVVVLALSLLFRRAARVDILAHRRELARSRRGTFWQHLRLDGGALLVSLVAYALASYLNSLGKQLTLEIKTLVLAPLTIAAAVFFILGVLVLFLRFFPLLLRGVMGQLLRSRGAVSMLAFAQMSRAPRFTTRTILLPAFAVAFVIFALLFTASQAQRIIDISTYEVGADLSGDLPSDAAQISFQNEMLLYKSIPGVTSVTVGYNTTGYASGSYPSVTTQIMAVDANTYAQTALWTPQNSTQPLASLMSMLIARRQQSIKANSVPVIVDASAAQRLHLSINQSLYIVIHRQVMSPLYCQVLAIVQHIPSINDDASSAGSANSGTNDAPVGILMDYETYSQVYKGDSPEYNINPVQQLPFNHVWMRASDNPATLATIRIALQDKALHLDNLQDRHLLMDELTNDPLYHNLTAFLILGAITVLLLALLGDLQASWISVRARLQQFTVFRALGAAPGQVIAMLTWEQGIVHLTALVLGGVIGLILAITAIPALLYVDIPAGGSLGNTSVASFYVLQQVVSPHIIVPASLSIVLPGLLVVFALALSAMITVTLRPSLSRALRLNED